MFILFEVTNIFMVLVLVNYNNLVLELDSLLSPLKSCRFGNDMMVCI